MGLKNTGIEAGAGCGKTTRITSDIIEGLKNGDFNIDDIVVITFTRKAASELKSRLSFKLQEAIGRGNTNLEKQLKNIGNANISTIHAFCAGLLKERPVEAKADPGCRVIDESEQADFFNEIFETWLHERLEENPDFYRKLVIEQKLSLLSPDYGYHDYSFQNIVKTALNYRELSLFSPKDPGSPEQCIETSVSELNKIKKLVSAQKLIDFMDDYIRRIQFDYQKDFKTYTGEITSSYKPGNLGGKSEKDSKDEWKAACEEHQFRVLYAIKYPEINNLYKETNREVSHFIEFYREEMRIQGVIDFGEILYKAERLLAENKDVREYFKEKFSYIFVDEFQDTDPLQARILFYLAEKKGTFAGSWEDIILEEGKIYVVGDPKQSIYRFRRADIEIYQSAMDKITGDKKEFLSTNYRSSSEIIDWVNKQFENTIKKPVNGNYQADYVPLKCHKKKGEEIIIVEPDLNFHEYDDQSVGDAREMEAKLTASWIKQFVDQNKYTYKDILLIYRNKKNMQRTAEYLDELDIPYEMSGTKSYFGRNEILDMANFLKAVSMPIDMISIIAALKGPFFSLSDKDLFEWKLSGGSFDYRSANETAKHKTEKALYELKKLHEHSRHTYAGDFLKTSIEEKGLLASYLAAYKGRQKVMNIIKTIEILDGMGNIPFCNAVAEFTDIVDQNIEMADFTPVSSSPDAVQLMTIHKAKGLENKVVYIPDGTSAKDFRNTVFIDNVNGRIIYQINKETITPEYLTWKDQDQLKEDAETERIRYVAATRAKEMLVINKIPYKGHDGTFTASFFHSNRKSKTEKIDISDIMITHDRAPQKVTPNFSDKFQKEIEQINVDRAKNIETARVSSLLIQSPSTSEEDVSSDINLKVLYNPETPDIRIEGVPASTIGTLAHKLMETSPSDLSTAATTLIKSEGLKIDPSRLSNIVTSLKNNEPADRISKAKNVLREVPIKYKSEENIYYDGIIDLLFEEEDGWVLVDYKTISINNDSEAQKAKEKYKGQLKIYQDGLEMMGLKVKEIFIVGC